MSTESPRNCTDPAGNPARSTATESHPYSSFEQGGVRRFERVPFARGLFDGTSNLPPFRIS